MLINVHDNSRMPIKFLWQLIFTFTFEKKTCGHMTKDIIGQQIVKWNGFIQINKQRELEMYGFDKEMNTTPLGQKGSVLDEMEYQLMMMASWVVREEKGEFESKVETYQRHKIDFRLVEPMALVFPEYCKKHRNHAKGQAFYKKNQEDFPEIYRALKQEAANQGIRKTYIIPN